MGPTPSKEDLARALEDAGGLRFLRSTYLTRNQAISRHLIKLGIETRPRNTGEQRQKVRHLLGEGRLSYTAIAKEAGVSKATVTRIAKEEAP